MGCVHPGVEGHHPVGDVVVGQAPGHGVAVAHEAGDGLAFVQHLTGFDGPQGVGQVGGG